MQLERGRASKIRSSIMAGRYVDRRVLVIGVQDFFKLAYFHPSVVFGHASTVQFIEIAVLGDGLFRVTAPITDIPMAALCVLAFFEVYTTIVLVLFDVLFEF